MRNSSVLGVLAAGSLLLLTSTASARGTIKNPGDHVQYSVEIEPHANFGHILRPGHKWGRRHTGHLHIGPGIRFTIPVADPAFVPSINNSVAISFGVDWVDDHYYLSDWSVWSPLMLQWNFFLHEKWSVFGEFGLVFHDAGPVPLPFSNHFIVDPGFGAGGRFHFSETAALTIRLGYPVLSVGVSFFL